MPTYLSPGVYVEEISSGSAPIASLGTSTAGFIGIIGSEPIEIPISPVIQETEEFTATALQTTFPLTNFPVNKDPRTCKVLIDGAETTDFELSVTDKKGTINLTNEATEEQKITFEYIVLSKQVTNEVIATIEVDTTIESGAQYLTQLPLKNYPVNTDAVTWEIKANGIDLDSNNDSSGITFEPSDGSYDVKVSIDNDTLISSLGAEFINTNDDNKTVVPITITADYQILFPTLSSEANPPTLVAAEEVKLCTNFNEFKKYFGDFSTDPGQNKLAHAVYGFFNNGGSRCYVSRVTSAGDIQGVLDDKFQAIDEIAIVAAPGISDTQTRSAIVTHCQNMGDRFAILDCGENKTASDVKDDMPSNSNYAAYYFPWIKVSDPVTKIMNPNAKGEETYLSVPPSGHIAGVYARVDAQRGVHKAPANEVIFGALGLKEKISKNQQDGLNPQGINCIRDLNGNIRIWGARTVGGDANGEFKYINVRRLFLSIRDSIEAGTQWTVFEPNDMELWAKIRRNVNAYLTNVWRSGALFGATPQEAFFVKCDAENNPPEVRDLGQVVIEIGVAPVKPAEFVIFRISQWTGSGG